VRSTNTQKFTVIQNSVGCSCPQTTDVCSRVECWVVAAPECGKTDLKDCSNTSKHYLSSPSLFPVLPIQYKQNTKIIIYRAPQSCYLLLYRGFTYYLQVLRNCYILLLYIIFTYYLYVALYKLSKWRIRERNIQVYLYEMLYTEKYCHI